MAGGSETPPQGETRSQIWIIEADSTEAYLFHESTGELSSPCWSPTSDGLLYVEWTEAPSDADLTANTGRRELVRRSLDGTAETLFGEEAPRPPAVQMMLDAPAASSDGRYVAFAGGDSQTLRVLDMADRKVVFTRENGALPSWSPSSQWLVIHQRGSPEEEGYRLVSVPSWTETERTIAARGDQAVVWDAVEDVFYLLRRSERDVAVNNRPDFVLGRRQRQTRWVMARVQADDSATRWVADVTRAHIGEEVLAFGSWSRRGSAGELAASILIEGVVAPIDFVQADATIEPAERLPALDHRFVEDFLPAGALAFSTRGDDLAFRFGVADPSAPAALVRQGGRQMHWIAPTWSLRLRALWGLGLIFEKYGRRVATEGAPSFGVGRGTVEARDYRTLGVMRRYPLDLFDLPRANRDSDPRSAETLDRAIESGFELLDGLAPPADEVVRRQLAEFEMLLRYLRGDYVETLALAERVADLSGPKLDPVRAMMMSILRIQCLVGAGQPSDARWEWNRLAAKIDGEPSAFAELTPAALGGDPEEVQAFERIIRQRMIRLDRLIDGSSVEDPMGPGPDGIESDPSR